MTTNHSTNKVLKGIVVVGFALVANLAVGDTFPSASLQAFGSLTAKSAVRLAVGVSEFPADTTGYSGSVTIANANTTNISSLYYLNGSQKIAMPLTQSGSDVTATVPELLANMNFDLTFATPGSYVIAYTLAKGGAIAASSSFPVTISAPAVLGLTTYNFTRALRFGHRGDDVKELQRILKEKGYFTYFTTTRYFGPITRAALKAFQKENGLTQSGILDDQTKQLFTY